MINRRNFLRGMFAAPAIVAVESIMPIKIIKSPLIATYEGFTSFDSGIFYCPYVPLQMVGMSEWFAVPGMKTLEFNSRYDYVEKKTFFG